MTHVLRELEDAPPAGSIQASQDSLHKAANDDSAEAAHAAVALFCALVALGIAIVGFLCRFGFADNSPFQWAKFVGLSWFLLFFSLLLRKSPLVGLERGPWRPWAGHGSLSLAALVLTALLGFDGGTAGVAPSLARGAALILFGIGGAGFVVACWCVARSVRLREIMALIAFAGIFSVYAACASSGNGYQNPLFVEGICFNYYQIDELYHASICNMLRTYGVPSTGLDGLIFAPYHFGSHWLFARLCNLLDVRVIDFYTRAYRVVFVPFGVFSLGVFAVTLARGRRAGLARLGKAPSDDPAFRNQGRSWAVGALFWLVVWTAYVSFMPYPSVGTPIYAWSSIVISESYSLGVAVSLLGLAWAWSFFQSLRDRAWRWSVPVVAGALFILVLMAALSLLKVSQSAILAAVAAFFFLRLAWHRSAVLAVLAAAAVAGGFGLIGLTVNPHLQKVAGAMVPFGFVRSSVEPELWPYFWLFYYAWLWIVLAVRFREEGVHTLRDLAIALRKRRLLDVEFLLVAAIAGAVPAMFLVPYSSAHYFADYQLWLAVGVLLSTILCRPLARRDGPPRSEAAGGPQHRFARLRASDWAHVTVGQVFLGAVVVTVAWMDLSNTLRLAAGMEHDNAVSRGHAGGGTGLTMALRHGRFSKAAGILDQTAAEVTRRLDSDKNVLSILRSIDQMPLAEKRASLLFIPKSNRQFWQLLHGSFWPLDGPLVAPALSGVAMIDGLCDRTEHTQWYWYSYELYPLPEIGRTQPPLAQYLPKLRNRCARMGFKQLIVIDNGPDGLSRKQKYDCVR